MSKTNYKPCDLLPLGPLWEVVEVLEHGAEKHSPFGWQDTDRYDAEYYFNKAAGHLAKYKMGETREEESGKHHVAHAIADLLFVMWHDGQTLHDFESIEELKTQIALFLGG